MSPRARVNDNDVATPVTSQLQCRRQLAVGQFRGGAEDVTELPIAAIGAVFSLEAQPAAGEIPCFSTRPFRSALSAFSKASRARKSRSPPSTASRALLVRRRAHRRPQAARRVARFGSTA